MRFVPWLVVTLIAGVAGACLLPNEDDFSGSYVPPDAGKDSGRSEAGPSPDGGTPADASPDAPVVGSCPRTAVYCNDFSDDAGAVDVTPGGSVALVNGTLQTKLPAYPDAGNYNAGIGYDLPAESNKAIVEVDLNISAAAWNGGNMVVLGIYLYGQPNHAEELYIDGQQSSVTTTENGRLLYDGATQDLPRGKWVHVKMEADFTPHQGSFRVSYDGVVAISHQGVIDFTPAGSGAKVFIGMVRNNAPTPDLTVSYDNLAITLP